MNIRLLLFSLLFAIVSITNLGAQTNALHWPETFEKHTKSTSNYDTITLGSGSWMTNDVVIGQSASDRKHGSKSLRLMSQGFITMNYDIVNSPNQLSLFHGVYGKDAPAVWALYSSIDSGKTWIKYRNNIYSYSTTLSNCVINISHKKPIRFQIRKISGGRLNIDDISVTNTANIVNNNPTVQPIYHSRSGTSCVCTNDTTPSRDNNMALGNPSGATTNTTDSNNYLVSKTQYSLSYNNSKGSANWVSWHLSSAWKGWNGGVSRCDCFNQDTTLPTGYFKASTGNYSNTGFDRGHLCPSDDRDSTDADNRATFIMSNITAQAPNLNQQTWGNLEDYCRKLVTQGNELYIIAGGYGTGGTGSLGGTTTSINSGKITVYAHFWKVIVVLPNGSNDVNRITNATRVIAVDMPNNQSLSTSWGTYRVSVDSIEAATGLDFLSNVNSTIQSAIESTVDTGATN